MLTTLDPKSKHAPSLVGPDRARLVGTLPDSIVYPIFLYADVLDRILDFSHTYTDREIGGFLLGGIYEDQGPYLEINQFLPATQTDSAFASLTFTHETWSRLNQQISNEFKGQIVLVPFWP